MARRPAGARCRPGRLLPAASTEGADADDSAARGAEAGPTWIRFAVRPIRLRLGHRLLARALPHEELFERLIEYRNRRIPCTVTGLGLVAATGRMKAWREPQTVVPCQATASVIAGYGALGLRAVTAVLLIAGPWEQSGHSRGVAFAGGRLGSDPRVSCRLRTILANSVGVRWYMAPLAPS